MILTFYDLDVHTSNIFTIKVFMSLTFHNFQITSYNQPHNQDKDQIYKLTPTLTLGFRKTCKFN